MTHDYAYRYEEIKAFAEKFLADGGLLSAVENYIIKEVQKVYRIQGIEISDKHIEIIVRQMLKKIRIVEGGDTGTLPGTHVNVTQFTELNREALKNIK